MNITKENFIRDKFREFYERESDRIEAPTSIEMREFGFLLFGEKIMIRHKSFTEIKDLRRFLREIVPMHVYYSAAYYSAPEEPMERKGWIGADLYFDIDADHIPTPCRKLHDLWRCHKCGFQGKGTPPNRCPVCGNQNFDTKTWSCEVCLEAARRETIKLIEFLMSDFGFSEEEVNVSFSGHRGYHVHIESEEVRDLNSISRKEIVDYITGTGLEAEFHGLEESRYGSNVLMGPHLGDLGWRGRIARGVYDFLLKAEREDLAKLGLRRNVEKSLMKNRDLILESWNLKGPWSLVKGVGIESWKVIIKKGIEAQAARIDTVVTTDIHRLIRLKNTLHGKTGLLKVELPIGDIESFDPLREAVAFKGGEVTVFIEEAPGFRIGEESYGPFNKEKVELPTAAALLLLCKGLAEVVE